MTIKVTMPQMGESVYEGTLTKWLKKVGDHVQRDEPLFEISTDKVDSEIPSPATGILSEILVQEGETIKVDTPLAVIKEKKKGDDKAQPGTPEKEDTAQEEKEDSDQAEEDREEKDKKEGRRKEEERRKTGKAGEEDSKEDKDDTSESDTVNEVRVQKMPDAPQMPDPDKKDIEKPANGVQVGSIRTSPLVRKIARENDVDLSQLEGTGLDGRITKDDILKYIDERSETGTSKKDDEPSAEEHESSSEKDSTKKTPASLAESLDRFAGETEVVPMTSMRKAIAEHMVFSKRTSPHVNTVFEVDMQAIVQLRERHKEEFSRREGIPLTFTPFFAKALVETVREFPIMNASLSGDDIVFKKPINLGIAVALDQGLIVPVIKNAQLKSLTGIALKLNDLATRARTKKLKPEEVQDGTISMTNPGSFGALFATPIINQPQVAILGIGGIEKRPVVIEDAIAIRSMVCLSLSFDHRVIDGATADKFMVDLKKKLKSWTQWTE
ncbi:MAG: dihydrolipoamide acetyltransferase family protein [Acidobacteriota bacterium]